MRLHHAQHLLTIFQIRFIACRAQSGGRRIGNHFQIMRRFAGQVDQIFIYNAAHAMDSAVNMFYTVEFARFQNNADQRLINHCRRTSALSHQQFAFYFFIRHKKLLNNKQLLLV